MKLPLGKEGFLCITVYLFHFLYVIHLFPEIARLQPIGVLEALYCTILYAHCLILQIFFSAFDMNGDGVISTMELKILLFTVGTLN